MVTLENYLADLPDLVTPEDLANKLGINVKSVYQRHWRQNKNPKLNLLPPLLPVPGSNRLCTPKEVVIEWWCSANQPQSSKRVGRPTKSEQVRKFQVKNVI